MQSTRGRGWAYKGREIDLCGVEINRNGRGNRMLSRKPFKPRAAETCFSCADHVSRLKSDEKVIFVCQCRHRSSHTLRGCAYTPQQLC